MVSSIGTRRGSSGTQRKSTAKCIKCTIATSILLVIAFQLWAYSRYARGTNIIAAIKINSSLSSSKKVEYLMWSQEEAYMRNCELHIKGNATWGKLHAPYVDKIEAKNIVERMKIPNLKIIPTLAVLDKENITEKYTLEFMKSLRQPYVIKSTHLSGGVARVFDNKYHCFKFCMNQKVMPLGPEAARKSKHQFQNDLNLDYSKNGAELQYRYITPRIIIEEDIISGGKTSTDVTFWWLSNGHPVYVSEQCEQPAGNEQGFQMKRVFVGTDFRRLPIVFNRGICDGVPPKPKTWDTQSEIMKQIGKAFPGEVVRADVYGGGDNVWFSEFTFTTAGCWKRFTPMLTDGLLYGLMNQQISPELVTPENVERMLTDRSWVVTSVDKKGHTTPSMLQGEYPSPVDLCIKFEQFGGDEKAKKVQLFKRCISQAKRVQKYALRCITSYGNGTRIMSFGTDDYDDEVSSGTSLCNSMLQQQKH